MMVKSKLRALPLVAAVLLILVAVGASPAAAATGPCWQRVINDWFDGEISATYQPSCYTDAIEHLPTDVSLYSDAESDIRAALLTRLRSGPSRQFTAATTTPAKKTDQTARTLAEVKSGSTSAATVVEDVAGSATAAPTPILLALGFAGAVAATGAFGWIRKRRTASPRRP